MRPELDYTTYDRFMVSLGVGALLVALAVPLIAFRELGALNLSQDHVRDLTVTAQRAIALRQSILHEARWWVPLLSGLMSVVGVLALVRGARGMRTRQERSDRIQELEEKSRRLDLAIGSQDKTTRNTELVEAARDVTDTSDAVEDRDEIRARYEHVETLAIGRLAAGTSSTHELSARVSVDIDESPEHLDALLRARAPEGMDVLVEVKYSPKYAYDIRRKVIRRLARTVRRYRRRFNRSAAGLVIYVVEEGPTRDHTFASYGSLGDVNELVGYRLLSVTELESWNPDLPELLGLRQA